MTTEPTLLDAIAEHTPYDGPHGPETVRAAASGVSALIRYLNNATGPWNQRATLRYAAEVDSVLAGIATAAHGLDQLLSQLAAGMNRQAGDPSLYDDRHDRPAVDTADDAAQRITAALAVARDLTAALDHARTQTAHLGNTD